MSKQATQLATEQQGAAKGLRQGGGNYLALSRGGQATQLAAEQQGAVQQGVAKRLGQGFSYRSLASYGLLAALAILLACLLASYSLDRLFPLSALLEKQGVSPTVLSRSGLPLRAFPNQEGLWRWSVPLDSIDSKYISTLLAYEDQYFWHHPGVNPLSLIRALAQGLVNGRMISGGSTLTMQVARLLDPHSKSFTGKVKQMARALQLEAYFSKRQILQLYVELAPFGGMLQGVGAASFAYFGKPAEQLSLAEAALLTVIPQRPASMRLDRFPERAQRGRDKVLTRLLRKGLISKAEWQAAKLERVARAPEIRLPRQAPLASRYLLNAMQSGAASFNRVKPGQESPASQILTREGQAPSYGFLNVDSDQASPVGKHNEWTRQDRIHSTLDGRLQADLALMLQGQVAPLPPGVSLAAMVVSNRTGEVLAYQGSAGFTNESRYGYIDMVQASRSPGSALKPFIYGMALEKELVHSHSLLLDVPMTYNGYRPENYHRGYQGPVSLTRALQLSLNTTAVQVLHLLGPDAFYARMRSAGLPIKLPVANDASLALALGGLGISLWHLVEAYTALAPVNQGRVRPLRLLKKLSHQPANHQQAPYQQAITQQANDQQEPHQQEVTSQQANARGRQLLSPGASQVIREILSSAPRPRNLPVSHHGAEPPPLAWKTGTSYGGRDAWALGVQPEHTLGVWVGRPDGGAQNELTGASTALPILFQLEALMLQHRGLANLPQAQLAAGQVHKPADSQMAPGQSHAMFKPSGLAGPGRNQAENSQANRQDLSEREGQQAEEEGLVQSHTRSGQGIESAEICWPLGRRRDQTPTATCHQIMQARLIDGVAPPTPRFDQAQLNAVSGSSWLTADGKRVPPACRLRGGWQDLEQRHLALWPAILRPWLPAYRQASRLIPPVHSRCQADPDPLWQHQDNRIHFTGITEGSIYKPLPGRRKVPFSVQALGTVGPRWWFVNDKLVQVTQDGKPLLHEVAQPGAYRLTVMDSQGQASQIKFQVVL